jgi:hypothetical protein
MLGGYRQRMRYSCSSKMRRRRQKQETHGAICTKNPLKMLMFSKKQAKLLKQIDGEDALMYYVPANPMQKLLLAEN